MARASNRFAIYIAGGRLISMLAGFIMPLALVRVMSQFDYGVFSQFFTLYTSFYVICAMGIHTNLFYFCPNATKEDTDKYVSNTLFLLITFSIIAMAAMFLPFIRHFFIGGSELEKYGAAIVATIALAVPMNIVSPLNTTREDKWGALFFPGCVAFARIATIILATLLFHDLYHLFICLLIFQVIIGIIVIIYTTHKIKFKIDLQLIKLQLAYSLPFGGAVALQLISNYYDKIICIHFLTPADYAIYAIAFLSIPGINQIYDSLCQVNIVNMSRSYHSGNREEIATLYGDFVIKTLSFSVPIILVVALFSEEIMSFLYTKSYVSSAPYFRLYSLTFIFSMLGAGTILRSMNKTKLSLIAFIITCIIGLPTTYFLVRNYGKDGAILGAMINILLPRFIQMGMEVHSLRLPFAQFLPFKKAIQILFPALMALIPLYLIKKNSFPNIFTCFLLSIIYVTILYWYYLNKNIFVIQKEIIENKIGSFIVKIRNLFFLND